MSKSISTKYDGYSVFSGSPKECDHHLIFGQGMRKLSEKDGLTIPLLNSEHNISSKGLIYQIHENPAAEALSKICGQLAWEKRYIAEKCGIPFYDIEEEAREAFRKRYGRSFL